MSEKQEPQSPQVWSFSLSRVLRTAKPFVSASERPLWQSYWSGALRSWSPAPTPVLPFARGSRRPSALAA
jgi:hypothetical protein